MRQLSIGRLIAAVFGVTVVMLFSIDTTLACRFLWRPRCFQPAYCCPPPCEVVTDSGCGSDAVHDGSADAHHEHDHSAAQMPEDPGASTTDAEPTDHESESSDDPPAPDTDSTASDESTTEADSGAPADDGLSGLDDLITEDAAASEADATDAANEAADPVTDEAGDDDVFALPSDDTDAGDDVLPAEDDLLPGDDVLPAEDDLLPGDDVLPAEDDLLPGDDDLPADDDLLPGDEEAPADTTDDELDDLFSGDEAEEDDARVANNPEEEALSLIHI